MFLFRSKFRKGHVMKLLSRLWADEAGFVVSSELVLIATVMVVGMLAGLTTIRDQVVQELADVADAVSEIDQSYSYSAVSGHNSRTAGSIFIDTEDNCDVDGQAQTGNSSCVDVSAPLNTIGEEGGGNTGG